MRIVPIALIVIGLLGVAKYFGLIPIGMLHLIGPFLLIALGVALLFRRPCCSHRDLRTRTAGGSTTAP
jgi:predicted exporter